MARIARTPPAELPQATPPVASARRMMRVTNPDRDNIAKDKALKMIENHLQLIAITQNRIDHLRKTIEPEIIKNEQEIERLKGVLETELKAAKLPGYTIGTWEARWVQSMGRSSRDVSPEVLFPKMKQEDFFKVVKVQLQQLGQFLSEREIGAIATTIPAKPGAITFVVQPVIAKKAK